MTQEHDTAFTENAQGPSEPESKDLTLEEESFLECLSSIVLRQLHAESPVKPEIVTHGNSKAA